MKKFVSAIAAVAAFALIGFAGNAYAGASCGAKSASADGMASSCSSKVEEVAKVSENVDMAKGGAAETKAEKVAAGDCATKCADKAAATKVAAGSCGADKVSATKVAAGDDCATKCADKAAAYKVAAGSCGADKVSATKVASGDCASKAACADKAAMKVADGGCSSMKACGAGLVAKTAENVDMAKGGAADNASAEGYGLGQKVPNFKLTDTAGNEHNLADYKGQVVMLVFYNQSCPYVVEAHDRISKFAEKYGEKGVKVLAIDSGINNPEEKIAEHAQKVAYPILVNRTSDVARKFEATRTPEVFILDKDGKVAYTGMFDSGQEVDAEGNRQTPAKDAVKALLNGEEVPVKKTKAFGCTIKFNPDTANTADAGEKSEKKDEV